MSDIDFDFVKGDSDYIEILENAIEFEEENPKDIGYLEDHDSCWRTADIRAHGSRVHQLEVHGFVDRVYDSRSKTKYALSDRETIKEWLEQRKTETNEDGIPKKRFDFPDEDELSDDLFNEVVGPYDDAKWLLRRGITTDKITNFLLVGPPGSAKTVFLLSIRDLFSNSEYIVASDATSAGVMDIMFKEIPQFMLIDEFDDMDKEHQSAFASYTETGILRETKSGKQRTMEVNTKTFGAANDKHNVKDNILDRFTILEFDSYTRKQFIDVCNNVLPMKENTTETEADSIAKAVWEYTGTGDVREAIQVARLSRGDPDKVIKVLDEYSNNSNVREVL